jgi:hypothetical protein
MILILRINILLSLALVLVVNGAFFNFENKTNDIANYEEKAMVANKRYLDNIWWRRPEYTEKEDDTVDPFFEDFSKKYLKMLNTTGNKHQQKNKVNSLESLLNKWIDQENKEKRKSNNVEQKQPIYNLPYAIRGG